MHIFRVLMAIVLAVAIFIAAGLVGRMDYTDRVRDLSPMEVTYD